MIRYNKNENGMIKFIYSEKATNFFEKVSQLRTYFVSSYNIGRFFKTFVAISECMNFTKINRL